MCLVDKAPINGIMKTWIYQHYILARLSWPFLVHDFDLNFAKQLERSISVLLKKWLGIVRTADVGILFRSRSNFGLGLTSISDHFG